MITFMNGNILESDANCLVNTVNCEGYMGKGIAYQFKLKFPNNNTSYIKACRSGDLDIGKLHYFYEKNKLVINFPTKYKWRANSRIEYIEAGLNKLVELIKTLNIESIAIPPLGCGNGGLQWNEVKELILSKIQGIDNVNFYIYEPSVNFKTSASSAPVLSTSHLVIMMFKPNLNKFNKMRIQKTAYFFNIFADELYFKFDKYKYGPYSHTIDILTRDIKAFQDYYNATTDESIIMLRKILISKSVEDKLNKFMPILIQSIDYVNSIKLDKELELLSTICYLIQSNNYLTEAEIIEGFRKWSDEKSSKFTDSIISDGIQRLVKEEILINDFIGNYRIKKQQAIS